MFIRPELRKGDIELRLRAPEEIIEVLDFVSSATGLSRSDVVLLALDSYCEEIRRISTVVAAGTRAQRKRSGNAVDAKRIGDTK